MAQASLLGFGPAPAHGLSSLREDLLGLGYPSPGGAVYLCCPIERRIDEPEWLATLEMGTGSLAGPIRAAPFAVSWQQLLDASA